jgi:uncharacterized protein YbgA (DUF1722 family)/uncharacterized protein YbbK (DUF523 family)
MAMTTSSAESRIQVGISSCLLGESVRFDSGHKRDAYINVDLAKYFEYVSFCPEVGIGMGIPRPPIRLVGDPAQPRAVGVRVEGIDVTEKLIDYAHAVVADLPPISGYLFKRGSPSCGMERVKIYTDKGMPNGSTSGLYASIVMRGLPNLPVEEEGRLNDPVLRENFVERVYVFDRWQRLCKDELTPAKLIAFHTRHKFLLLSHSETHYRRLGRLVADAGTRDMRELSREYVSTLMDGLKRRATRRRHSNVLQHIMGYLKRSIDTGDKAELNRVIAEYKEGTVPLIVPMKLIEHHFRRHPDDYMALQIYLAPHPTDLGLRNHL